MKPISRLSSGRVVVKPPAQVSEDRYQLLDLASAEPNLGTAANGSVLTTTTTGQREWTKDLSINNATVSTNLVAGTVYTNNLLFANGDPYISETTQTNIYNGNITIGMSVTLVDTVPATGVSSVRWTVTARDTINGTLRSSTIDSVNDGITTYYNEYGVVLSDNAVEVAVFTSTIEAGIINLYALGESAEVTITYQRTTLGTGTLPGYIAGAGYIQNVVGSGTATTCVVDTFTGTGSQTNYTLGAAPGNKDQVIAVVAGVVQPKSVYTVSGAVLTFSAAPDLGVPVEFTTFVTTTITGYAGSVGAIGYTGSSGTFSGVVTGNLSVSGTTFVTGDIIPTSNNTVNIGSPTSRFGTLYLAANTIDLGGTTISTSPSGDLTFVTARGSVDITANTVNFLNTVATTSIAPGGSIGGSGGGGGGGVTAYNTVGNLPVSGANGDMAYVTATNGLYIWNGSVWFLILTATTPNDAPYITQGPDLGYVLSTTGTPTVITLAAQDPESVPITWSYTITSGTLGNTAVISNQGNVFTITPSTDSANAGQFEITFTASDGVNIANARSYIRLRFSTEDYAIGVKVQNTIIPTGYNSAVNAKFGKATSANAGILAVSSAGRLQDGTADTVNNMVSVFSTLNGTAITPLQEIVPPANILAFGEYNLVVWANMLMVPGERKETVTVDSVSTDFYYRTVHVYYRTGSSYALTQTIEFPATTSSVSLDATHSQPLAISESGLVMACATPGSTTGVGPVELRIFTRESGATTTWTLRQTISGSFSGITDYDRFPTMISISTTGKHIALTSPSIDDGGTDFGKIFALTNINLSLGTFVWTATASLNIGDGVVQNVGITRTSMSDDIFYFYSKTSTTSLTSVEMLKYDNSTSAWLRFPYSNFTSRVFKTSISGAFHDQGHFVAIPGQNGTNQIIFATVVQDPVTTSVFNLVLMRMNNFDISGAAASDNFSVYSGNSSHVNVTSIPNNSLTVDQLVLLPYISFDQLTGQLYVSTRGGYNGVTESGGVTQYVPVTTNNSALTTAYDRVYVSNSVNYTVTGIGGSVLEDTYTVIQNQRFLHAVCVGAGGGGGRNSSATSGASGGGGGGALRWITNYPVFPGDVVRVYRGAQGGITTSATEGAGFAGGTSYITVNGVTILQANGGGGGTSNTSLGGAGGGGTATGTSSFAATINGVSTAAVGTLVGGGNGGNGGAAGAGGGAGGYGGNGGNGAAQTNNGAGGTPSGGGGGGGSNSATMELTSGFGGGVGLYGLQDNGVAGTPTSSSFELRFGKPGSTGGGIAEANTLRTSIPGTAAPYLTHTLCGGGGVGAPEDTSATTCFAGHHGGARLIIGDRYVFTNNAFTTSIFVRPPTYTST